MEFKPLTNVPLKEIVDCHNDAFSDYSQPMNLPLTRFREINVSRGVNYALSIGACDEGQLVGFILNAVRGWQGISTA